MGVERLEGSSSPSLSERRDSEQPMVLDPPRTTPTIRDDRTLSIASLAGESIEVQPTPHGGYAVDPSSRQYTQSLGFTPSPSIPATPGPTFKHPFVQPSFDQTAIHTQSHAIEQSHAAARLSSSSAGAPRNLEDFGSMTPHTTQFAAPIATHPQYMQHSSTMDHHNPFSGGYNSSFYVQPGSTLGYESNAPSWSIDNPFEMPVQGVHSLPFSTFDVIYPQMTENIERIVAEGLDVSVDRESTKTPSDQDDSSNPSQHPHDKGAPTSHPGTTPVQTPAPVSESKDSKLQRSESYLGYEYWDHRHDTTAAVANMDFKETTNILLQDHAKKSRLINHQSSQASLLSNISLSEEKRDDIKSLLDDTWAHSKLNNPSKIEKDAQRLPRLEIFNVLLKSYFHNFHPSHPILHLPSFLVGKDQKYSGLEQKKDILIYAMCCAGAFKHTARPIQEYASGMQELLRRTFNYHFEKDPRNLRSLQSMQAIHLAIYVGGWSGNGWASEHAQALCGQLDTMLRCSGWLDGQRGEWLDEELREVAPGDETERWHRFIEREEKKRLICAQYTIESQLGAFTRSRISMMWSELNMPMPCEDDLWRAESAESWAKLWNDKLRSRMDISDEDLFNGSPTAQFRFLASMSEDINSAQQYLHHQECVRHLPFLLIGIHSMVTSLSDGRSNLSFDSKSITVGLSEASKILRYWRTVRELCAHYCPSSIPDEHEGGIVEEPHPAQIPLCVSFHFTGLSLHVPLRDIRLMNEHNHAWIRKAAIHRLWRTWKEKNGDDARMALWHAGQILRRSRSLMNDESCPPWIAPMIAEAANVMWSYAALIDHDQQLQRGNIFNDHYFVIDSEQKLEDIPLSTRLHGLPAITTRKEGIIGLVDQRTATVAVTECAEVLNRGSLKRPRAVRGRTIFDEQFIKQLDKLVKYGNFKVSIGEVV